MAFVVSASSACAGGPKGRRWSEAQEAAATRGCSKGECLIYRALRLVRREAGEAHCCIGSQCLTLRKADNSACYRACLQAVVAFTDGPQQSCGICIHLETCRSFSDIVPSWGMILWISL